jgi:transcriptional regulator with XRE-family HTH domain
MLLGPLEDPRDRADRGTYVVATREICMTESGDARTLADKLGHLFRSVQPLGREYSNEEVARGCTRVGLGTFSKTYVWQLRTGQRDNPTKRHLEALAAFFGVPPAYFFDDRIAAQLDPQLAFLTAMRDTDVHELAVRLMRLDDIPRKTVMRVLDDIVGLVDADKRTGQPPQM